MKGCYVNGEVDCSSDVTCASSRPADESQSCESDRNKQHSELSESQLSPDADISPGQITEQLQETCHQDCAQHVIADNSINRHHSLSEVQSQSQKLTNGTDESCSLTTERSDCCKALELNAEPRSDDTASETARSPVDTSYVSESTRLNTLDAVETFASIIGREIAASFDLKEGELSPPESQGDAGSSFSLTSCSTTCTVGSSNSKRPLQSGSKLLGEGRKSESDKGPPLDTVEVARRVRDILTANNVGQRQFARYVLGLSQGTVSELLAKPKPWDRLTEKGKESYWRMNQWAGDHLGVMSLKGHLNSVALKANLPLPKGSYSQFLTYIQSRM